MSTARLAVFHRNAFIAIQGDAPAPSQVTPRGQSKPKFAEVHPIGKGAFGHVFMAKSWNGEILAIKKVIIDKRFKNRELEILLLLNHPNCIKLHDQYKTRAKENNGVYLNLVTDFLPMNLHQFSLDYRSQRNYPPVLFVKLFAYQLFSGLNYIHNLKIVHRDIKPQNILVDPQTGQLEICDFGSAKIINDGTKSVSYIASRYYRAPELLYDDEEYSAPIDIWAAGCVIAEVLMAGTPIFVGQSSIEQLQAISKIIGAPTQEELDSFPHTQEFGSMPSMQTPLKEVLPRHIPQDVIDLLQSIFVYSPGARPTARQCMQHRCFDDLFKSHRLTLPSQLPFPQLERELHYE